MTDAASCGSREAIERVTAVSQNFPGSISLYGFSRHREDLRTILAYVANLEGERDAERTVAYAYLARAQAAEAALAALDERGGGG